MNRRAGTGVHTDITGTGAAQEPNNAMEVKLMETTMNNIRPGASNPAEDVSPHSAASRPPGRPDDDVVRRREFRQAQWLVGIALAAILGSQGFLYAAIMDLQRDVQTQIGDLRTEMRTEIKGLRTEMHAEINGLRERVHELSERVHELSERVARIETRLGMVASPADPPG